MSGSPGSASHVAQEENNVLGVFSHVAPLWLLEFRGYNLGHKATEQASACIDVQSLLIAHLVNNLHHSDEHHGIGTIIDHAVQFNGTDEVLRSKAPAFAPIVGILEVLFDKVANL